MRKFSILFEVALLLSVLLVPSGAFADAVLSVSAPASVAQGSSFSVDVNISGVSDLYAWQLDLTFDPTLLSATNVTEGTFLNGGNPSNTFFLPGTIDNVGGSVTLNADTLLSVVSGISGAGTLITFDFTALAQGTSPLAIANEILLDSTGAIITDTTSGSSVTVTGSGPVPTPEPNTVFLLASAIGLLGILTLLKRSLNSK